MPPDRARGFDHAFELAFLIVLADQVSHDVGCESALRAERQSFERDVARSLFDPAPQLERRIAFRRAMKKALTTAMKFGAKGVRIQLE